ncbi:MAG: hypothetical protein NTX35_21455 [Verrucomicrobia bacterium]|nr:hypothetical protein [Verrucomicrobiota bacterium]
MLLRIRKFSKRYREFRNTVTSHILPKWNGEHDPLALRVEDFKKSDTLYVMGSGSSILDLPQNAWEDIREEKEIDLQLKVLRLKLQDYRNTAFLLRDVSKLDERLPKWKEKLPLSEISNLYTIATLRVAGRSVRSLRFYLRWYRRLGLFNPSDELWGVPMKRATVFLAMSFALMAGYRRIVLCGVDLSNAHYFYNDPRFNGSELPLPPTIPATTEALANMYRKTGVHMRQAPNPAIHNTIDPALNPLPMDEVIHAFNEEVLKPEGVELFVALPSSKLYPRIPALFEPMQPSK